MVIKKNKWVSWISLLYRKDMETVITKRCWLKAQLPCYRFIVEESQKSYCIHALILFKENVPLEQCQCHFETLWPCTGCFVCSKYTTEHKLPSNEERKHKAKVKIPNTAYPNHHINIEIPHCFKDHIYFTRNHLNYVSSWHWLKRQNNKVEHWWQENW